MNEQGNDFTKWRVLAGALIIQLILGTVYGYSIFWEPLGSQVFPEVITQAEAAQMDIAASELGKYTIVEDVEEKAKQIALERGYLKYAFSICLLTFAMVMVLAGRVQDIKGPRFPAIVGAVLLGLGFITAGVAQSTIVFYLAHAAFTGAVALVLLMVAHAIFGDLDRNEIPVARYMPNAVITAVAVGGVLLGTQYVGKGGELDHLFLLWGTIGFLAGAGIGFAYVCPIAALVKWFPEHKGLVSGLAVAGFGFGAFMFKGQAIGAQGYISERGIYPFFITHGVICLVAVTLGAMLLRNPPGYEGADASSDTAWQDTLKSPAFYVLWLMFFSGAMAGLMVIGIVKPFVTEQVAKGGLSAEQATAAGLAAVGYLAIFNALGRVAWGFASDKIGRTAAFIAMFSIQAVTMFLLGNLTGASALCIASALVGFNFGGNFALFPSATADLFGARNLGANYGWVFTSYGIAGVIGIAAGNFAKIKTGSYSGAFTLAAILCALAAVLGVVVGKLARKHKAATA